MFSQFRSTKYSADDTQLHQGQSIFCFSFLLRATVVINSIGEVCLVDNFSIVLFKYQVTNEYLDIPNILKIHIYFK